MNEQKTNPCYTIRIAGTDIAYACPAGDTLLGTSLRAGMGFPYECNAGGCGSCKFELVQGQVNDVWPDASGIRPKEKERGRRLACQSVPLSDCEIKVSLSEAYVPQIIPHKFEARFLGSRYVAGDIREFQFEATGPAAFLPGQYALIRMPGVPELRAYSMSNQPNGRGEWNFMIRRVPGGKISGNFFNGFEPGSVACIDGPYGIAHLRTEPSRDIVCIAGGSGLAPIVSIVNGATAHERLAETNIWMFYGGRGPNDIPKFEHFIHTRPNVVYHSAISVPTLAEGTDWKGEVCMVHELLPHKLPKTLEDYEYYLAGPPPMVEAVVRLLIAEHKVPAQQIHYDRFF